MPDPIDSPVTVDPNVCEGIGYCQQVCPEVFQIVDGVATVTVTSPTSDEVLALIGEAELLCPTDAITTR